MFDAQRQAGAPHVLCGAFCLTDGNTILVSRHGRRHHQNTTGGDSSLVELVRPPPPPQLYFTFSTATELSRQLAGTAPSNHYHHDADGSTAPTDGSASVDGSFEPPATRSRARTSSTAGGLDSDSSTAGSGKATPTKKKKKRFKVRATSLCGAHAPTTSTHACIHPSPMSAVRTPYLMYVSVTAMLVVEVGVLACLLAWTGQEPFQKADQTQSR